MDIYICYKDTYGHGTNLTICCRRAEGWCKKSWPVFDGAVFDNTRIAEGRRNIICVPKSLQVLFARFVSI